MEKLTERAEWKKLEEHCEQVISKHLRQLFEEIDDGESPPAT